MRPETKIKYLAYALLVGATMLTVGWFINRLFSPLFLDNIYGLGESVIEAFGLPSTIG